MKYFLFVLTSILMLFACSIDDVAARNASETTLRGPDFDVGFRSAETSAALTAIQIPQFSCDKCIVPGASMSFEASTATTCAYTITNAVAVRPKAIQDKYWRGGNTKASRCKAVSNTFYQYRTLFDPTPYAFGRDIRRLSCKA